LAKRFVAEQVEEPFVLLGHLRGELGSRLVAADLASWASGHIIELGAAGRKSFCPQWHTSGRSADGLCNKAEAVATRLKKAMLDG
jgi:hypothetical protein